MPAVLHTDLVIGRRLTIVLLVATVLLAGTTACPRNAASCTVAMRAHHACCEHAALRSSDCCCKDTQPTPLLSTTVGPAPQDFSHTLVALPVGCVPPLPTLARVSGVSQARSDHGLAPPDTLVLQHTQLLL